MAQGLETLAGFGRTFFRNNHIGEILSVAPCQRRYACPIAQCLQTT